MSFPSVFNYYCNNHIVIITVGTRCPTFDISYFSQFPAFDEPHFHPAQKQHGTEELRPQPRHHGQEADRHGTGIRRRASTFDRKRKWRSTPSRSPAPPTQHVDRHVATRQVREDRHAGQQQHSDVADVDDAEGGADERRHVIRCDAGRRRCESTDRKRKRQK